MAKFGKTNFLFGFSLLLRFAIVYISGYLDQFYNVKYTDVDYVVFTDASRFVSEGKSPYNRLTYRYTPILSYLLLGNIFIHPSFGKYVFSLLDIVLSYFMYSMNSSLVSTCLTVLLNPIMINVSTRGNADQIIVLLVVMTLYFIDRRKYLISAICFGFAIHMKIYPIIYTPTIFLHLINCIFDRLTEKGKDGRDVGGLGGGSNRGSPRNIKTNRKLKTIIFHVVKYFLVVGILNILLLCVFYYLYGWTFLYETYLYHLVRSDNRHNFSVYFYMIYLSSVEKKSVMSVLLFVPQFLALLWISWKYYKHLALAFLLQTLVFVAFNKVCTVQYFIWYIPLFAVALKGIEWRGSVVAVLFGLWMLGQGLWLYCAYLLEFEGENSFLAIWISSLVFFFVNIAILLYLMSCKFVNNNEKKKM